MIDGRSAGRLSRRGFLGGLTALAVSAAICGAGAPGAAARARGSARIDVREHGAHGDGVGNDTDAFQAAIDALPPDGGTVHVPAGAYVIDPTRSVRLRSRMHLSLDDGARLLAMANAADRAYVLLAQDVADLEISGGRIVGDRDTHLGESGEWGHGIMIRGSSRITLRDLHISRCWGDGVSVGGMKQDDGSIVPSRDVLIAGLICDGNRRQGLTVGRSRQVRVRDCEFVNTGGALPGCGIDVEPDPGDVARDVRIERCLAQGNAGPGIQFFHRVAEATVRACTIEGNRGDGVFIIGASDCAVSDNLIRRNGLSGVNVRRGTRNVVISGNRFTDNRRNLPHKRSVAAGQMRRAHVTVAAEAEEIRVAGNHYDGKLEA